MAKEWILNMATNRWGLNKKTSVGPVAQWIREEEPRTVKEWEEVYKQRLARMLQEKGIPLTPEDYLRALGERLYVKITEVIRYEVEEVTEEDCIAYIHDLVIRRTFEGYQRELKTVYARLQQQLGLPIEPCPDEVDRRYHVDFWIPLAGRYIGIQIKPITYMHQEEVYRWLQWMEAAHRRFTEKYGGKVFVIFSRKQGRQHIIANPEVIKEIRKEVEKIQREIANR